MLRMAELQKIARVEAGSVIDDLEWQQDTLTVAEIIQSHQLPLLVQFAEGNYSTDEVQTVSYGETIKLDSMLAVNFVEASIVEKVDDSLGLPCGNLDENLMSSSFPSTLALPKSMTSMAFELVAEPAPVLQIDDMGKKTTFGNKSTFTLPRTSPFSMAEGISRKTAKKKKTRFNSVKSLAKHRPAVVRVVKLSSQLIKSSELFVGQKLRTLEVIESQANNEKCLRCRIHMYNRSNRTVDLNMKWKGVYEAIPEVASYMLDDLLNVHTLPLTVRISHSIPASNKLRNPKIASQLKQIRTLDLHLRLEREVTTYYVIGVMGGALAGGVTESLVILSKNAETGFRLSTEMEQRSERYQEALGAMGRAEAGLIPMEMFLSDRRFPMCTFLPIWELRLSSALSSRKKKVCLRPRRTLTSGDMTGAVSAITHSYIDMKSSMSSGKLVLNHPTPPPKAETKAGTAGTNTQPDDQTTITNITKEDSPVEPKPSDHSTTLDTDITATSNSTSETSPRAPPIAENAVAGKSLSPVPITPTSPRGSLYNEVFDYETPLSTAAKRQSGCVDAVPRNTPPPVPYRKRRGKSKSRNSKHSWFTSFRRNPDAERRPLPDIPQEDAAYANSPDFSRPNVDVVRTVTVSRSESMEPSSSTSSAKKRDRRKSANDAKMTHASLSSPEMGSFGAACPPLPPLPPRTPSLEDLVSKGVKNKDKNHRKEKDRRKKHDAEPLSPRGTRERRPRYDDGTVVDAVVEKKRGQKVHRHHSNVKHKHTDVTPVVYRRKMSAPTLTAALGEGHDHSTDRDVGRVHTFHDVSDAVCDSDYLVPDQDLEKEEVVQSPTSVLKSPTHLKEKARRSGVVKRVRLPERTFNTISELPREVSELTCGELAQALRLLNMRDETAEMFANHQVNGALVEKMDSEILKTEFGLTNFELFKITQFIGGWRP